MVKVTQIIKIGNHFEQVYTYGQNICNHIMKWPNVTYEDHKRSCSLSIGRDKQQKICRVVRGFKNRDQESAKKLMILTGAFLE